MEGALCLRGSKASTWVGEGVALGTISTQLSVALRPDGSVALAGDLRLDNRRGLADRLGCRETADDCEVAIAAHHRWGHDMAAHLSGDFAFAVWEDVTRSLYLARDQFGVRVLYYCALPGRLFAFATEPKAILAIEGVPRRLDEVALFDALMSDRSDEHQTFYRDVRRLPRAHGLVVGGTAPPRLSQYWELDAEGAEHRGTAADFAEAFLEQFQVAVAERLAPAPELGCQLSGGLDSSSITCMARHLLPADDALRTYTATFSAVPQCDERPFVDAIVTRGGYVPTFVPGDRVGPLTRSDELSTHLDGPVVLGNLRLSTMLCEHARADGVAVMLDGFDGDSTVSHGKHRLEELARAGRVGDLWRQGRGFAITHNVDFGPRNMAAYLWVHALSDRLVTLRGGTRALRALNGIGRALRPQPAPVEQSGLVSAALRRSVEAARGRSARPVDAPLGRRPTERREHVQALGGGGLRNTLECLDAVTGAYGIQPRYPFWDKELIQLCVSLPAAAKLDRGWTRVVMRDALDGILPPQVQWRRDKSNLAPSFLRGLVELDRDRVDAAFASDDSRLADFVDVPEAKASYAAMKAEYDRSGGSQLNHAATNHVFLAASVGLWLEQTGL